MHIRRVLHTRSATIIACTAALILACGTGAVAAAKITSADIRDHTIQTVDLKAGSVTTKVLKANSVGGKKIKANNVNSSDVKDGSLKAKDLNAALNASLPARVKNLNGAFTATNGTVTMTPDGVNFGPYADGGATGGSLVYNGLNGQPLSAVKNLVFYARYVANNDTGGVGVPFLRIFLNDNADDAIFSPNTQQPNPDIAQGPFHEWVATSGSWRFNDDAGNNPDITYAALLAAHGNEPISRIVLTVGFTNGTNLQSLLRWTQINGKTFTFGS